MPKKPLSPTYKKRCEAFKELFIKCRKDSGMTQNELALKSGVSIETIRSLECGRSCNPSFLTATDLLGALGIKLGEVKKWTG